MKFDDLDAKMRVFETAHDHCVLPGLFMVARLDGRGFTRLTKERHNFEAPFDVRFRDMMAGVTEHLLDCGFRIIYGYTQSDEISLLIHPDDDTFHRKTRKLNSVLAGEASAKISLLLGDMTCFDCRLSLLPNRDLVRDYFRWRNEDASRNSLNSHGYWRLRQEGLDEKSATNRLTGLSVAEKNELLFHYGVNFNDLPSWQKRGLGIYWQSFDKEGVNPVTGETVTATRRRLTRDLELPFGDKYGRFIDELLAENVVE